MGRSRAEHLPQPAIEAGPRTGWLFGAVAVIVAVVAIGATQIGCADPGRVVANQASGAVPAPAMRPPSVTALDLAQEVDLRLLAIRPNNPSFSILDLAEGTVTTYPPGSTRLGGDAVSGATITPRGDAVVWAGGTVYLFAGIDLSNEPRQLRPSNVRTLPDVATELFVVPTADGARLWVVQPGRCCPSRAEPTLVDLIDIGSGAVLVSVSLASQAFPVGDSARGLVLAAEDTRDTGDGWTSVPDTQRMILVNPDAGIEQLGDGTAIATFEQFVAYTNREGGLIVRDLTTAQDRVVRVEGTGWWTTIGGPAIPSTAQPLPTVSSDGRLLLSRHSGSATIDPTTYIISIRDAAGSPHPTDPPLPHATTWSSDGQWLVGIADRQLVIYNTNDGRAPQTVRDAVPEQHWVLGAG